nr:replication factor C subunit 3 [Cavia porcellus]
MWHQGLLPSCVELRASRTQAASQSMPLECVTTRVLILAERSSEPLGHVASWSIPLVYCAVALLLTPSKKKIEISTIASNYHLEVNPSDAGNSDRVVIQEMLKTVAQSQQLETNSQRDFKVYLWAVWGSPDLIAVKMWISICHVLSTVCKKEGLSLPSQLAQRIAEKSCRNLRKALLMCEACRVQQYPFTADQEIPETDWEVYLRETANAIVSQQTPQRLLEVRGRLYELLTHCIPPEIIMKGLLSELLHNCDGQLKGEVTQMAAYYEHRLQLGTKAIYHLEAFVAKFMALYKKFMEDGLEGMMF